jgi:YfiH family protein
MRQVHGATVRRVDAPGDQGEADALFTTRSEISLAAATADCVPIVVAGNGGVAVVHAGWRGAVAGIVPAALAALDEAGVEPERAALGPAIRACCYEVGPEVAAQFRGFTDRTTWGTTSLDLPAFLRAQLQALQVWDAASCTMCTAGFHSHRGTGTPRRQVTLGWM